MIEEDTNFDLWPPHKSHTLAVGRCSVDAESSPAPGQESPLGSRQHIPPSNLQQDQPFQDDQVGLQLLWPAISLYWTFSVNLWMVGRQAEGLLLSLAYNCPLAIWGNLGTSHPSTLAGKKLRLREGKNVPRPRSSREACQDFSLGLSQSSCHCCFNTSPALTERRLWDRGLPFNPQREGLCHFKSSGAS